MKISANNFTVICLTLIITAVISWYLFFKQARENDTVSISRFPKTIGSWSSVDLPISKEDLAILETKNAFARRYKNFLDKNEIYLYIVYSQNNRKVAHPPEICYTGSGITITESVHDPIKVKYKNLTVETNRLRLTKENFDHIAYYWFKIGDRFTSNYWKQQILIAFETLIGKKPSSALIRVSADVRGGDEKKSIDNIKKFINLITPDLFLYLP